MNALSVLTTFITISAVGGPTFFLAGIVFGFIFYSSEYPKLLSFVPRSLISTLSKLER